MSVLQQLKKVGIVAGAALLAGGIVLLFAPTAASSLPFNLLVAELAALGAVGLAIWVVRTRYRAAERRTVVPDVELPLATPTPGDDVDDLIYQLTQLGEGRIEHRERIFERMEEIATTVLMEQQNCSEEAAKQQLRDGTWTDDALAAAYFDPSRSADGSSSLFEQIRNQFSDEETGYEKQLRATIRAIEEVGDFVDVASELAGEQSEEDDAYRALDPSTFGGDEGEWISETTFYRSLLTTHHWTGITAFSLAALTVGVLASKPAILLGSVVGIGVAGYAYVMSPPTITDLEVTRTVSDESPEPGDEIDVTLTVENTGDTFMPDLTIVDQVPALMEVVEGSPRIATALRAGSSATMTYTAVAERGEHLWPVQVVGRDVSGSRERDALVTSDTTVECSPRLRTTAESPVRLQTSVYAGEVETGIGGEGLEFHSVRDYQPGDPKRRIDWKTYARTGEFSTIDFREEHAARIVLLFDARSGSYVSRTPGEKHALNASVDAAFDVFASLYDQGHLIGIAAYNGIPCWLGPNTGQLHVQRVRQLFVDHPAISTLPPELADKDEGRYVDPMTHIRRQLPENTQIFLFSPLTDHYTYEVARRLNGAGHLVTIVSPDPTADRSIGQRLARLERSVRIKQLRDHGIRVVDWGTDRPLDLELEHASRRWRT